MNYESHEISCDGCGRPLGFIYIAGKPPKKAYCRACFGKLMGDPRWRREE